MKIAITSDFHGQLPEIPACDLLIIGGDIAPSYDLGFMEPQVQWGWMQGQFRPWLEAQPVVHTIAIPGNHDWWAYLEDEGWPGFELLIDSTTNFKGWQVHGTPWSLPFFNWAFMKEADDLALVHKAIPQCDILISHGPPYGYGDCTAKDGHVGAISLNDAIVRIKPKLVVTGHIHEGAGIFHFPGTTTTIVNNSLVSRKYKAVRRPILMEFS